MNTIMNIEYWNEYISLFTFCLYISLSILVSGNKSEYLPNIGFIYDLLVCWVEEGGGGLSHKISSPKPHSTPSHLITLILFNYCSLKVNILRSYNFLILLQIKIIEKKLFRLSGFSKKQFSLSCVIYDEYCFLFDYHIGNHYIFNCMWGFNFNIKTELLFYVVKVSYYKVWQTRFM